MLFRQVARSGPVWKLQDCPSGSNFECCSDVYGLLTFDLDGGRSNQSATLRNIKAKIAAEERSYWTEWRCYRQCLFSLRTARWLGNLSAALQHRVPGVSLLGDRDSIQIFVSCFSYGNVGNMIPALCYRKPSINQKASGSYEKHTFSFRDSWLSKSAWMRISSPPGTKL